MANIHLNTVFLRTLQRFSSSSCGELAWHRFNERKDELRPLVVANGCSSLKGGRKIQHQNDCSIAVQTTGTNSFHKLLHGSAGLRQDDRKGDWLEVTLISRLYFRLRPLTLCKPHLSWRIYCRQAAALSPWRRRHVLPVWTTP